MPGLCGCPALPCMHGCTAHECRAHTGTCGGKQRVGARAVCLAGAARGHQGQVCWLQTALDGTTLCHQLPMACPICCGSPQLSPSLAPCRGVLLPETAVPCPRQAGHTLLVAVPSCFSGTAFRAPVSPPAAGLSGPSGGHLCCPHQTGLLCPSSLTMAPLQVLLCQSCVPALILNLLSESSGAI